MMGFIRKIKEIYNVSQRILILENELKELDNKLAQSISNYSNEFDKKIKEIEKQYFNKFEQKIKNMTFAYTKNLDDTKSDYLKRYLESRLDCMGKTRPCKV